MKIQQFLEHHGILRNPFVEEDAQTDQVFREHCIKSTYHAASDKIIGDPLQPSTSVVFGEKGSGKTALRLQIVQGLTQHNAAHPNEQVFVIEYDNLNPFLDRFQSKMPGRLQRPDLAIGQWKLWDHMDAILSLGTTRLMNEILGIRPHGAEPSQSVLPLSTLDRYQRRDLLLLAACYDDSQGEPLSKRWTHLRGLLRYQNLLSFRWLALGAALTCAVFGLIAVTGNWSWLKSWIPYLILVAGWIPFGLRTAKIALLARSINKQLRVLERNPAMLRKVLARLPHDELAGQPLPNKQRSDDRYELLGKLQSILRTLGYGSIVVILDRLDEPNLVNGSPERMKSLLWSLFDNKLLKHEGIGFKLLLPIELSYFIEREDREFYQRARLDKQNLVPSLQWTGEALFDVANARVKACSKQGASPTLSQLFDPSVDDRRLISAFRALRVPRGLFKFLYRVFVRHCQINTDDRPNWKISSDTFEAVLSLYLRDQDAFERGVGAG